MVEFDDEIDRTKLTDYIYQKHDSERWTYDQIILLGQPDEDSARDKLDEYIDDLMWGRDLTFEYWMDYVRKYEKNPSRPITVGGATVSSDPGKHAKVLSGDPDSAWLQYKKLLDQNRFSKKSIANVEASVSEIVGQLSDITDRDRPVKGLVFGTVQSGKTAVMEGIMSAAADGKFNLFIVLSGTIESLRLQTEGRFRADLENHLTPTVAWKVLNIKRSRSEDRPIDLELNGYDHTYSGMRYIVVCLKEKNRLKHLIDWLYKEPSVTSRMRIIVIDDEADQASVNTAEILPPKDAKKHEQERKAVNQLIVNLVNGKLSDGSQPHIPFQAMNYISFTATPYANVLNERPGESLYPRDFVRSLTDADEYFGTNAIFGNPEYLDGNDEEACPGLNIVRSIPQSEAKELKAVHKGGDVASVYEFPQLRRALAWFLCSAAVLRTRGWKKPISMLVHTSGKTDDHLTDYEMVRDWLWDIPGNPEELEYIHTVYDDERSQFTRDDLARDFSAYGLLDKVDGEFPSFDAIKDEIKDIASLVGNIQLDGEGGFDYSLGVNICIDNCRARSYADKDTQLRVVYPSEQELAELPKAPIFIVMGGNTLSRGLTIEGLVCTYFSREVGQADTLMQMARWFGYRRGYELLQRIWMTPTTLHKYQALARVDMDLKREIERFKEQGLSPEHLGVKVNSMPDVAKFKLTSKKKMQSAVPVGFNFTGYTYELTEFDADTHSLEQNIKLSEEFLTKLSDREHRAVGNAHVWYGVSPSEVIEFLRDFGMSSSSSLPRGTILEWLQSGDTAKKFKTWNVAVSGKKISPSGDWALPNGIALHRIERTKKDRSDCIDIGSLRSGLDAICDVDPSRLNVEQRDVLAKVNKEKKDIPAYRAKLGYENTPLLLLYRIDKESAPSRNSTTRSALGTSLDIMSFSVIIPGDKYASGPETELWIPMNPNEVDD